METAQVLASVRNRLDTLELELSSLRGRIDEIEHPSPEPVSVHPVSAVVEVEAKSQPPLVVLDPPAFHSEPQPSLPERARMGAPEWEALVGGSILNKLGALVLVIGIALFLGYSFTHLTPAGRALTCLLASGSLLSAGVLLERRAAYRIFARGLIGAGWASLYVTAYAIYAVPAARLIQSPLLGSILLFLVAAAMIGHSLLYRRQAITAVAYFTAFAALSVTPWSVFGLVGLLPLAASLLYLAARLDWQEMALYGILATYGSCLWHGDSELSLFACQALLLTYWLLFEGFDLLRVRRSQVGRGLELLFPANAVAFLGLSLHAWVVKDPAHLWAAPAFAAELFLMSAAARWLLRTEDRCASLDTLPNRAARGSFEGPLTIGAALIGAAIALRAVGNWLSVGLALEAEVLYVAGALLDLPFFFVLSGAGFTASLLRLLDVPGDWTAVAIFHASLFYLNRALRKSSAVFSYAAAVLVAAVLYHEFPVRAIGASWLLFGAILFEIGLRLDRREFRFQSYALAAGGVLLDIAFHALAAWRHPAIPLGAGLVIVYALYLRARFRTLLPADERKWFEIACSAALTSVSALLVWHLAPDAWTGTLLCALSLVLLEAGRRHLPAHLTYGAVVVAAIGIVTLTFRPTTWIAYALSGAALYVFSEGSRAFRVVPIVASFVAAAFALRALWLGLPADFVAPSWAALAVLFFWSGLRRQRFSECAEAYAIMCCALIAAAVAGFPWPAAFIAMVAFSAEFMAPSEAPSRTFWSLAGTLGLTALLFERLPGAYLTTAAGLEGVALLAVGFVLAQRVLRLEGIGLLLLCILKLFLYDLRNLETPYRILSFVALGVILLAVSSLYSRFREYVMNPSSRPPRS